MAAILITSLIVVIAIVATATLVEALRKGHRAIHAIARQLAELEAPDRVAVRPRRVRVAVTRRPLRPASAALSAVA
jgi:hypothetical protein